MFMLLSVFIASPLFSQNASAALFDAEEAERLTRCESELAVSPGKVYEDSLIWMAEANRPKARYCNGLALIAVGRPARGAERLENLAAEAIGQLPETRALYYSKAGAARLEAGEELEALANYSAALELTPDNGAFYKARAGVLIAMEEWVEAEADLDIALLADPDDAEARQARARARLGQSDLDGAQKDVDAALMLDPQDIETLVLRGDIREAKRLGEETLLIVD